MTIQLIIEFVFVLGALIFIHEFGHYIACKIFGIEVEEFGFGYPPRALKLFEFGGTKFTLNWIPFGGFVRPKGQDDPSIQGGLAAANPWKRIAVLLAGPFMNLLMALVLFFTIYSVIGYLPSRDQVQIAEVSQNSPASAAGLQAGDILVSVGGISIHSPDAVKPVIVASPNKPVSFVYERKGVTHEVNIVPEVSSGGEPLVGIVISYAMKPYTVMGAIPESAQSLYDYIKELFSMLGQIIRGQSTASQGRLVGIKGMFDMYAQVRESAGTPGVPTIVNVLVFIASINISLGLFNLLPVPAVDGGRIAFALPEIIIRRRIPPKYEMWVNLISFALLILLMIFINLQDFIHPITTPIP